MERCDFSSIITTLRRYISDDYITNQTEFLEDVFQSCLENDSEPIVLDMGLVCRWFTGQARISPKISQYYAKVGNRAKLADDLENNVLRMMYDSSMHFGVWLLLFCSISGQSALNVLLPSFQ